jgi:hypothetical protein
VKAARIIVVVLGIVLIALGASRVIAQPSPVRQPGTQLSFPCSSIWNRHFNAPDESIVESPELYKARRLAMHICDHRRRRRAVGAIALAVAGAMAIVLGLLVLREPPAVDSPVGPTGEEPAEEPVDQPATEPDVS